MIDIVYRCDVQAMINLMCKTYDKDYVLPAIRKGIKTIPAVSIDDIRGIGIWRKSSPFTDTEECSGCQYNIPSREFRTPHCPWCGVRMKNWNETE